MLRAPTSKKIPCRLTGPNALYVFKARVGVMIRSEPLAAEGMDVLIGTSQELLIISDQSPR